MPRGVGSHGHVLGLVQLARGVKLAALPYQLPRIADLCFVLNVECHSGLAGGRSGRVHPLDICQQLVRRVVPPLKIWLHVAGLHGQLPGLGVIARLQGGPPLADQLSGPFGVVDASDRRRGRFFGRARWGERVLLGRFGGCAHSSGLDVPPHFRRAVAPEVHVPRPASFFGLGYEPLGPIRFAACQRCTGGGEKLLGIHLRCAGAVDILEHLLRRVFRPRKGSAQRVGFLGEGLGGVVIALGHQGASLLNLGASAGQPIAGSVRAGRRRPGQRRGIQLLHELLAALLVGAGEELVADHILQQQVGFLRTAGPQRLFGTPHLFGPVPAGLNGLVVAQEVSGQLVFLRGGQIFLHALRLLEEGCSQLVVSAPVAVDRRVQHAVCPRHPLLRPPGRPGPMDEHGCQCQHYHHADQHPRRCPSHHGLLSPSDPSPSPRFVGTSCRLVLREGSEGTLRCSMPRSRFA